VFPRSYDGAMRIVRLGRGDENVVLDDRPVGFVSGVEMTHPDKGTEMFLYELNVRPDHRNRGVGRALVRALADVARTNGCYGMWVLTDSGNAAALAAYRAAGAGPAERSVMLEWRFEGG
jgi:[ribosomal protein S18]-alanine N-acetyltransferase